MKTVKLNNGTILEVGKTYVHAYFDYPYVIKAFTDISYVYNILGQDREDICKIDLNEQTIPYTAPQEDVKWKTFLIERGNEGNRSRRFVQYDSLERAKTCNPHAKKITEVEIDIKEK